MFINDRGDNVSAETWFADFQSFNVNMEILRRPSQLPKADDKSALKLGC